jgi:hypothetical protein
MVISKYVEFNLVNIQYIFNMQSIAQNVAINRLC